MKSMKHFRSKSGVKGISLVLSLALVFNMVATMPVMAYWKSTVITIPAHWETQQVWVPPSEGYPGYWEDQEVWVPEDTVIKWIWIEDSSTTEPIDTTTGNNYFTEGRIFVPCPGISLEVGLKYQSVTSKPEGRLGKGWHHNYEWTLDDQITNAVVHTDSGSMLVFELGTNGLYQPNEGSNWTLEDTGTGYELSMPSVGMICSFATNGLLSSIHDAWENRVECSYGTNDCLEAVLHSNGRQIVFSNEWHAASGEWRVSSMQVPGGTSLAFNFNGDGQFTQLVEQVGANSYTSTYSYADGFLTNKVNGAGFEYTFGYEEENGTLNGKGTYLAVNGYYEHEVSYEDFSSDVTYRRRGQDQIFRYARNWNGQVQERQGPAESIQDIEQRGVRYAYSTNGMDKIEKTLFDNVAGATCSRWMQYDDAHNLTNYSASYCSTNPVHRLSLEYDPVWQLPSAIEDADDLRLEIVYTNGLPLIVKAFHDASNSYDTAFAYTTNGLPLAITNANNHVSSFGFDSLGNMVSAAAELGPIVTNTYNTLGFAQSTEMLSESGVSTGRIVQYGRNAKGWVTEVIFADGLTNAYARNALGYITNIVDRAGRATDYTYAPTRKLTSATRWLKQGGSMVPVRIGYDRDKQVNLLRISEPRGRYVESYQFDIQDRVVAVTNIEGQVMDIDYSVGNFVKQVTRFDGSTITNTYDNAGRKDTATYNPGSASPLAIDYDYYPDNQLEAVSDGTSTISNRYNRLNRLERRYSSSPFLDYRVDYDHDPVGNVTGSMAVFTAGTQKYITTGYTYDETERLKTRGSHAFTYSPESGRIATVSNTVSGITCSYSRDIMNRVTNITYRTASSSLIRSLDYAYDASSMITNKAIAGGASSTSTAYEYDSLNRLTGESTSTNGGSLFDSQYSYDLAGNRLTRTVDGIGVAYTLGAGNRLASARAIGITDVQGTSTEPIGTDDRWGELWVSNLNAQIGWVPEISVADFWVENLPLELGTNQLVAAIRDQAGNTDYTTNTVHLSAVSTNMQYEYNAAGCMTNLNGVSLEWDERYRLTNSTVSTASTTSTVSYAYDVFGRKASRTISGSTEHYIHEGNHVLADLYDNLQPHRVYAYGPSATGAGMIGIDNILTMTVYPNGSTSGTTYHYIKDHQNSVIALTDASGAVVETYEYDAYGNTKVFDASGAKLADSAYGNRYCFQGREIDWDTGLYYFRARWYDPETGRWLSKDPIGIRGGLNQYVAFGNNPANFIDPFGLDEDDGMWRIYANRATNIGLGLGGALGGALTTLGKWALGGIGDLASGAGSFANGLNPGSGDGLEDFGDTANDNADAMGDAADGMWETSGDAFSDAWNDETTILDSIDLTW